MSADAVIRDLQRRIRDLERNQVVIRQGQVNASLEVELGSSGQPIEIPSLVTLNDGDLVSVAVQGKKQVVIGIVQ